MLEFENVVTPSLKLSTSTRAGNLTGSTVMENTSASLTKNIHLLHEMIDDVIKTMPDSGYSLLSLNCQTCGAMMQMTYELTKFGKRKNIGRPEHEMCTASASDLSGCLMFAGRRKRKENVGDRIDFFFAVLSLAY
ncbi:hypothetical protein niasHT_033543 [Heterodera trifolii]|uniref:Uncharacterized protein n=1 Tax=Heterodera trifolii TaxID=157864 RepID=A0ABD2HUK5_9BILA